MCAAARSPDPPCGHGKRRDSDSGHKAKDSETNTPQDEMRVFAGKKEMFLITEEETEE